MLRFDSTASAPGPAILDRRTLGEWIGRALRAVHTRHWSFAVGSGIFLMIVGILALTPWIAPYDPAAQDLLKRLSSPSAEHWLGADQLGRDVLSRLLFGGQFSVTVAAITVAIAAVFGTILGAVSARTGGILDEVTMRAATC